MHKRTVVVPLSALAAAAGLAGGAYAASQPGSHPHKAVSCGSERALISDAARRLHVTPTRLTDALKQALVDQIDSAAAAGHLPRAQANVMKRQIEHSPRLGFGPGLFGPGVIGAQVVAPPGFPRPQAIRTPGRFRSPAVVRKAPLGLTARRRNIRILVRAPGPPACFAGPGGLVPAPVPRTLIGPPRR